MRIWMVSGMIAPKFWYSIVLGMKLSHAADSMPMKVTKSSFRWRTLERHGKKQKSVLLPRVQNISRGSYCPPCADMSGDSSESKQFSNSMIFRPPVVSSSTTGKILVGDLRNSTWSKERLHIYSWLWQPNYAAEYHGQNNSETHRCAKQFQRATWTMLRCALCKRELSAGEVLIVSAIFQRIFMHPISAVTEMTIMIWDMIQCWPTVHVCVHLSEIRRGCPL